MFESPVKQNLSSPIKFNDIPFTVVRGRQTTGGYSVLLVVARRRDLSRSANALSAENRKFFPPPHLALSFGVTPFEFMEKLY